VCDVRFWEPDGSAHGRRWGAVSAPNPKCAARPCRRGETGYSKSARARLLIGNLALVALAAALTASALVLFSRSGDLDAETVAATVSGLLAVTVTFLVSSSVIRTTRSDRAKEETARARLRIAEDQLATALGAEPIDPFQLLLHTTNPGITGGLAAFFASNRGRQILWSQAASPLSRQKREELEALAVALATDKVVSSPNGEKPADAESSPAEPALQTRNDQLALAALWATTHERLALYHEIGDALKRGAASTVSCCTC